MASERRQRFLDGCHRYGWLITMVANLLFIGLFMGGIRSDLNAVMERTGRVERLLDQLVLKMFKP